MRMPRLRYMERPGRTIADSLVEKDPWYRLQGGCTRETCPVCYWQKGKGISCTRENINYKLECVVCEEEKTSSTDSNKDSIIDSIGKEDNKTAKAKRTSLYLGESSRSARERVGEHLWLFSHNKQACEETCTKNHKHSSANSALWAHSRDCLLYTSPSPRDS